MNTYKTFVETVFMSTAGPEYKCAECGRVLGLHDPIRVSYHTGKPMFFCDGDDPTDHQPAEHPNHAYVYASAHPGEQVTAHRTFISQEVGVGTR